MRPHWGSTERLIYITIDDIYEALLLCLGDTTAFDVRS